MARWTVHGLQRGAKEAVQGIQLVIKNPHLRQQKFLHIFLTLTIFSLVVLGLTHLLVIIPLRIIRALLFVYAGPGGDISKVEDMLETAHQVILDIVSYVPVLALLFMRYVYPKPLDDLFMEMLRYIDEINKQEQVSCYSLLMAKRTYKKEYWPNMKSYMQRTWKKVRLGLLIFILSLLPVVGRFVFPAAGAYATLKSLGKTQGIAVGICFFFLPRWATMQLIRSLIGMRTLMRELLDPYFVRMNMSHKEKRRWFSGRKDVLFGFSAIAYLLIRVPYFGFVGYGVAQAAAAYMLTTVISKENDDPASPSSSRENSVDDLRVNNDKLD
ncbi:uncharacterized protein BX664DRAFT_332923 [Halteromyces radiatus]|uniref:uncharacterized protein n=1 Tax=Halteromyces radiatus TaxID=101107 RepID=UPI002220DE40|nr:uncharacterized protein BX664DRAFT_332923 [Halteromyces radiatus]KAI8089399.1 hypothetical protein BX664DRAFT_332923 [Halteromyces radiatus]